MSQEIANEMSLGALKQSEANLSISVTGIAGPEGGSKNKPVGTVFFAIAKQNKVILNIKPTFAGSREEIRRKKLFYFLLNKLLKLTL